MSANLTIHIDGGARGNPGPAGVGVVLRDTDTGKIIHEGGYYLGKATNNEAEYRGLLKALELATPHQPQHVTVLSDSQLMVRQVTGQYRVKAANLGKLLEQAHLMLLKLDAWHIRHVPREQNKRADELANMAMDAGRDVVLIAEGQLVADKPDSPPARNAGGSGATKRSHSQGTLHQPGNGLPDEKLNWSVHFRDKPGPGCPVRNMERRFEIGSTTPQGLCVYAAQAVFDENITLWLEAMRTTAETHCAQCGAVIDVEMGE